MFLGRCKNKLNKTQRPLLTVEGWVSLRDGEALNEGNSRSADEPLSIAHI